MSDAAQTSREAVLARLRTSTHDAVVLEEMRRLGFWPEGQPSPEEGRAAAVIEREAALIRELHEIHRDLALIEDPQAALKAMSKERKAAARARREETRRRHAQQRYERALAWHARQAGDIVHLGEGVSAALNDDRADAGRLARHGLPELETPAALAAQMGIPVAELRFLAYHRAVSRVSHYQRFGIAKKTGGTRLISAPMPRLKRAQYWVLDRLLAGLPVHEAAHGFVPGRSIVGNARPHVGRALVVNLDLKDFFPSIEYPRVRGLFQSFGYSRRMATILALICTETPTEEVELDGTRYHVQSGPRRLPQGAPTSPALTNLLCRRLDRRLTAAAARLGFTYTRYADDMTFSADADRAEGVTRLLWRVKRIIADEGFALHPDKQRIMRAGSRQEVTGIVVNRKPSLCRDTLRRFRAVLFQVEKDGPEGKSWNGNTHIIAALEGYARFVRMVDAERGDPLCRRVAAVRERWGAAAPAATGYRRTFREASAAGRQPPGRVWTPAAKPEPVLEKTAGQIREEKAAQRAREREAAQEQATLQRQRRAALAHMMPGGGYDADDDDTEPDGDTAGPAPAAGPLPYARMAIQFAALLLGGVLGGNFFMLIGSIVLLYYFFQKRRTSAAVFIAIVVTCIVLRRWLG